MDEEFVGGTAPYGGLSPEQFDLLTTQLRESVILVDENWELIANLSAPAGLLGWGDPVGTHVLAHIHPDDVINLVDIGQDLADTPAGWIGATRMRLQRVDGTYGLYEATMENRLHDPDVRAWVCCTRLIDSAETAPEMAAAEVTSLLVEALPQGLLVFGGDMVLFSNDAACDVLGVTRHELSVSGLANAVDDASLAVVRDAVRRLGRSPGVEVLVLADRASGRRRFELGLTSRPSTTGDSKALVVMCTVEDVTHEVERQEFLERRATRDDLTSLHNRAWLLDRLHERLRVGDHFCLAYLDLCGFKAVNDTLGHRTGDRVLAAIAAGLMERFGDDAVARVGGDEFVIFGAAGGDAEVLSLAVREAVETVAEARANEVAANVGTAASRPADGPWDVIERADAAMYEAKRADPHHRRHQHS